MPAPHSDGSDPANGFDPDRHRKDIELMEQRFRERSERHGSGPVTTGEIDGRVADEMREFFDASEQQLKNVVPRLQQNDGGRSMAETTDEIRKKINDFFAEVKDGGARGGKPPTATQRLSKRKARWTGALPLKSEGASRANSAPPFAQPFAAQPPARRDTPVPRTAESPDAEKMDLKTALEKLRRHGVVKQDDRVAADQSATHIDVTPSRVAQPPAPRASVAPPAPPLRHAPTSPPQRREPPAPPPPQQRREPPPPAQQPRREPPPQQQPPQQQPQTRRAPPPAPAPGPIIERRPPRPAAAPAPAAPAPRSDPSDGFDSIFKEVEGIVLDTLKTKSDGSSAPPPPPTTGGTRDGAPISEPVSQLVSLRTDSEEVDVVAPIRTTAGPRPGQFKKPAEDADEEPAEEAPPAPYDWGVKPAARPTGAWLLDVPDASAEPAPTTNAAEGASAAPAAPEPEDGAVATRGARNFLVRKAGDEVRKFQPVIKALKDQKVLEKKDLDGPAAPVTGGGDDFLSADSFHDDVPRGADVEAELSPMRLVEELRRIKRVTQALIEKGVITAADLERTGGGD